MYLSLGILVLSRLSNNENKVIHNSSPNEQMKIFIAYWTRKEAILKAIGCGIINDLKEIDSTLDIYNANNTLINDLNLQESFENYHVQTFSINEMIISVAHPQNFTISTFELNSRHF